jgi:hypothetical protein
MELSGTHRTIWHLGTIRYTWSYLVSWNYPVHMELSDIMELFGTHGTTLYHGTIRCTWSYLAPTELSGLPGSGIYETI